jgi:hypothetical protein
LDSILFDVVDVVEHIDGGLLKEPVHDYAFLCLLDVAFEHVNYADALH